MLGGTLVNSDSSDPKERRLLNIVEEIAIASGVPVPLVYVMENESGINAFAAGLTTGDAVIAVTRGTMDHLNRAELQGVIAREFCHFLNGDMRLHMRLIGVLFGILIIGLIGRFMMRITMHGGGRSSREGGGIALALIATGAGLAILGWVGTIFGNMIKASVSRQREYLADASAVQFTRNPDGIANALKKIGASSSGSIMQHPDAAEFSHAYFGDGMEHYFGSVFATHPPLEKRILRIQPSWDGEFIPLQRSQSEIAADQQESAVAKDRARMATYATVLAGGMEAIKQAGHISDENIASAANLLQQMPEEVKKAVREPHDSRAIIYSLLIDQDRGQAVHQLKLIADKVEKSIIFDQTLSLLHAVHKLESRFRLPLIDMAMPALRQLSSEQYKRFKNNLNTLIHADNHVSMFEWALHKIVVCNLDLDFERRYTFSGKYGRIKQLTKEYSVLLSYLARATPEADPQQAIQAAMDQLDGMQLELLPADQTTLDDLDRATDKLVHLKPLLKPQLLKACAACIAADAKVTAHEMELLRALSALLDCPLPPLPENLPYTN
jgi:Zn-dependent protease with chaperone function